MRRGLTDVVQDKCFAGGNLQVVDAVLDIPRNVSLVVADHAGIASSFGHALAAANLSTAMDLAANLTLLVPSNKAFEAAAKRGAEMGPAWGKYVVESHVLQGPVLYSNRFVDGTWTTQSGAKIRISRGDGGEFFSERLTRA